jgi:pentatricopeptide repeat protein
MLQTQSSKLKRHIHVQVILFIQIGFNSNVFVGGSLVDISAKCGSMEDVCSMFNKMQSENVVDWNAILRGCDTHGHGDEFLKHFGRMFEKGVIPYVITFDCLLSTCKFGG